jgi:hypothetical protein
MTGWLKVWGASQPAEGGMHMGDGMMSAEDMKKLGSGPAPVHRVRAAAPMR